MVKRGVAHALYGIVGYPVKHSASPSMQNAAFEACGIDAEYVTIEPPPPKFEQAILGIKMTGFKGLNITVPYKQKIIPHVDELTPQAQTTQSVNTVRVEADGRFVGTSTDGEGLIRALHEEGVKLTGKKIMIVGAGGAACAVAVALAHEKNMRILVTNRTEDTGKKLVAKIRKLADARFVRLTHSLLSAPDMTPDVLVNCTTVGMHPKDRYVFDLSRIASVPVVMDLIYNPARTFLLARAEKAGSKAIGGLGMLLHQGALAFEFWTGRKAPVGVMREALEAFRAQKKSAPASPRT